MRIEPEIIDVSKNGEAQEIPLQKLVDEGVISIQRLKTSSVLVLKGHIMMEKDAVDRTPDSLDNQTPHKDTKRDFLGRVITPDMLVVNSRVKRASLTGVVGAEAVFAEVGKFLAENYPTEESVKDPHITRHTKWIILRSLVETDENFETKVSQPFHVSPEMRKVLANSHLSRFPESQLSERMCSWADYCLTNKRCEEKGATDSTFADKLNFYLNEKGVYALIPSDGLPQTTVINNKTTAHARVNLSGITSTPVDVSLSRGLWNWEWDGGKAVLEKVSDRVQ